MKLIQTASFVRLSVDINRQPSFLPEDGPDQDALFDQERNDKRAILNRWKKNRKVPTEKIYQFGVDVPIVKKQ